MPSSTRSSTKWATTPSLPSEVTITSRSAPASAASAATSSMPGVSTTGSNSFGTVLVAGRNRVPKPAAGTIAVRGIGTSGRVVIVHTLTSSTACNRVASLAMSHVSSWTPWQQTKAELRAGSCVGPPRVAAERARRRGRRAARTSDRPRAAGRHRLRLRARRLRTRFAGSRRAGRRRGVRVLLPVAREDDDGARCRCSGASTAPAAWSRRRYGLREPRAAVAAGRRRSRPARRCWCRRSPSTGTASGSAAARASTTGRWPLADPAARLVAVVRDDELVDELPGEPHDVPMTHALTPGRRPGRAGVRRREWRDPRSGSST